MGRGSIRKGARRADKPILLDIGAVWCHWCHVIDRESYENPEIAAMINQLYIPVKVDRDERPDVDARYQSAISAISGQGGWPLTAFLTPDGKPFFGGTYFPPEDAMGRPGFKRILLAIAEAFKSRRTEVDNSAEPSKRPSRRRKSFHGARGEFRCRRCGRGGRIGAARYFDEQHGGFGQSPKFPHASAIDLLLETLAIDSRRAAADGRRENAREEWPQAASTTSLAAASIATRWTSAGACRTSKKCRTTIPSC